ncbi:MAG: glycosyltransferase family 2 protein [Planctomycetota bacterium]|nr:glycosyltransferase family 2 protein [Planctomycetota bacterium]
MSAASRPVVSVIVPMHNGGAFIERALGSLIAQELAAWEAVVVDDGSTDDGAARAARMSSEDGRIEVVRVSRRGVAGARNLGLERTSGPYVVFLDADDWLMPGGLGALLEGARASDFGAAFGGVAWHEAAGAPMGYRALPTCREAGIDELLTSNRFSVHAQMLRRDTLGAERFNAELGASEDYDLWLRLADQGVRWRAVDRVVGAYRLVPSSRSRDWAKVAAANAEILRRAFERARRGGAGRRLCDVSETRARALTLGHALDAATACALGGPEGVERGAELLRRYAWRGCVTAERAAASAAWAIPAAACAAPGAWRDPPLSWCAAARGLWERAAREGWAEASMPARALGLLAERAVDGEPVAREIAARLDLSRPVVLLGLGMNGRRLAGAILAMDGRAALLGVDDALEAGLERVSVEGGQVRLVSREESWPAGAQIVVTVGDDGRMRHPAARREGAMRWSAVRSELARAALERVLAVWDAAARGAAEAAA